MPVVTDDKSAARSRCGRYPKEFRRDLAAVVTDQKRTVAPSPTASRADHPALHRRRRLRQHDLWTKPLARRTQ